MAESCAPARSIFRHSATISRNDLPKYAHPVLLRMRKEIDVTADLQAAQALQARRDGYDPSACPDALYVNDTDRRA